MNTKKDKETDTESWLGRLFGNVILFVVCCYLIKLGVCWLVSVRVPLLIIAVIAGVCVIIYRARKWRDYYDDY